MGTYKEVMEMEIEDALLTYSVFYIDAFNEYQQYLDSKRK